MGKRNYTHVQALLPEIKAMIAEGKQAAAGFSALHRKEVRARVKYHIIYRYKAEYPVAIMCKFFGVSRSGYYAFVRRLGRPEKDAALAEVIAQQRERSFRTYGYRRMWLWLKHQNIFCNPKTVAEANKMIHRYIHFYNHERIQLKTGEAPLTRRLSG